MIFCILLAVVIVVLISVTVHFATYNIGGVYGPTDTRVIYVSNALCETVHFNADTSFDGYQVSLYRLNSKPELTGHEAFSLIEQPSFIYDEFKFYYYYMPKGSKVSMSACLLQSNQDITFYMIKGDTNIVVCCSEKEFVTCSAATEEGCTVIVLE